MAEGVVVGVGDGEAAGAEGGGSEVEADGCVVGRNGFGRLVVQVPKDGNCPRGGGGSEGSLAPEEGEEARGAESARTGGHHYFALNARSQTQLKSIKIRTVLFSWLSRTIKLTLS